MAVKIVRQTEIFKKGIFLVQISRYKYNNVITPDHKMAVKHHELPRKKLRNAQLNTLLFTYITIIWLINLLNINILSYFCFKKTKTKQKTLSYLKYISFHPFVKLQTISVKLGHSVKRKENHTTMISVLVIVS